MSRHNRRVKHFDRKSGPRKALLRGLVVSLVEHERIATTVEKAKELRRHVERAITIGKKNDLSARRLLISRIANSGTADKIISNLSPRFKNRNGGYTRIIKIGRRPGDTAEMAFIEFVDYDFNSKETAPEKQTKTSAKSKASSESSAKEKGEKKASLKAAKAPKALVAAKKKTARKLQKKSRTASRSS